MKKSDFYFELPEELIAQTPLDRRDASRLMLLDKNTGETGHRHFYELPELLRPGDCLVLNDSRVLPARLFGNRKSGGVVEVLLLRELGGGKWECLTRPGRKTRPGTELSFGDGELSGTVLDVASGGNRIIQFNYEGIFLEALDRLGRMPLPPYIKAELEDRERYQTVYSREPGSAAAPTAGLHFTKPLLEKISETGVNVCYVTLHVGLGTFRPVKEEEITEHEMHSEFCIIPEATARIVTQTKRDGGRVVCVGTTSCRTLESFAKDDGSIEAGSGWTNIFIYPGYRFKCVDALVTNFHLPESTLIMLVSALAGRENVLAAYREAVEEKYRFFSFGDAMFIGYGGRIMEKLTDMPNIGPVLAGNLEKIGVTAPEQLRRMGAREAFLRIRAEVDPSACLHQLEALEGAAEGVKKSFLPEQIKEELKAWYKAL